MWELGLVFILMVFIGIVIIQSIQSTPGDSEIKTVGYIGYNQTLISNTTITGQVISTEQIDGKVKAKVNFGDQHLLFGTDKYLNIDIINNDNIPITGKYTVFNKIVYEPNNCRYTTEYKNGTVLISNYDDFDTPRFFSKNCQIEHKYHVVSVINGGDKIDK